MNGKQLRGKIFVALILAVFVCSALASVNPFASGGGWVYANTDFESGAGGTVSVQGSGAYCDVSSADKYAGSSSLYCFSPAGSGNKAYRTYVMGVSSEVYLQAYVKFLDYPNNIDNEGGRALSVGNSSGNILATALGYTTGGAHYWGVRRLNAETTWATNYNASHTYTTNTWYCVELHVTKTSYELFVNGVRVLVETGLALTPQNYDRYALGINYNGAAQIRVYIDNVKVASTYIGSNDYGSASYYTGSNSYLLANSSFQCLYPMVNDGLLYVAKSHTNGADPATGAVLSVYDSATNAFIKEKPLNNGEYEIFTPQVYDGKIYLPAISRFNDAYNGSITILNLSDLSQVAYMSWAESVTACTLQMVIDKNNGYAYFGIDPRGSQYRILKAPLNQLANQAAYEFVDIAPDPEGRNSESQITLWNNQIYVLVCGGYVDGTAQGTIRTGLYHKSVATSGSWTKDWEVTGLNRDGNSGGGGYFSHLTASERYMVAGVLSNAVTGKTTYRTIFASNATPTTWTTIDTLYPETAAEDHPTCNAISDDIFLYEPCSRQGSSYLTPHVFYAFNVTAQTFTYLFRAEASASNGYNDRWVAIDAENSKIYVGDNANYLDNFAGLKVGLIMINWNLPLKPPTYLDPEPEPTPSPTPIPITPTPSPITVTPSPTPIIHRLPYFDMTYYFHATSITVNAVSGYLASDDQPNLLANATSSGLTTTASVIYGIRIFLVQNRSTAELTQGVPVAQVTAADDDNTDIQDLVGTWTIGQRNLDFGRDALKFTVYVSFDDGSSWTAVAIYMSENIFSKQIQESDLTVHYFVDRTETTVTVSHFYWGGGADNCLSGVTGFMFKEATNTDWQSYHLGRGNLAAFMLDPYVIPLGNTFFGVILLAFCMALYIRYRQLSPVVLFLILIAGTLVAGGVNIAFGEYVIGIIWAVCAFGLGLVYWRVFR